MIRDARDDVLEKGDYLMVVGERDDHIRVEVAYHPAGPDKAGISLAVWQMQDVTESTATMVDEVVQMHSDWVYAVRATGGVVQPA
jgi:hypothetical protein